MYSTKLLDSKKLKVAILGAVSAAVTEFVVVFFKQMGVEVPQEVVLYILAPFLAYIGGKSVADVAYNIKNGNGNGVATIPAIPTAKAAVEPTIPPVSSAAARFKEAWNARGNYVLSNTSDPNQVAQDFLSPYAVALQAANELWRDMRHTDPPEGDPCARGDKSFEARMLNFARSELAIRESMVSAIKASPYLGYQLEGLGYLLSGVPWNNLPDWVKANLEKHLPGYQEVFTGF